MNKILGIGFVSIALLISACAEKDVSVANSGISEQENIETAVAEAPQPQEETPQPQTTEAIPSGTVVGSVYFDFDKYNIRPDMQGTVDDSAQKIKDSDMNVLIEGNTDEFGSDEYNYALGTKRALTVKNALVVKGIAKDKIKTISYGESKPICQEKTKACYEKNRRADVKLVK
ncbi:OmpA family protein [Helicobacter cappadocius]|uniref:Peptidoglycan-associated lipoprotein n=1 Tax=Helicobacter cappadocius TaxID=3063998 RepID=A0AA90TBB0_9HELI|nr:MULTISPECIES: OmpA family protein [unclassified Helicobacter]MDO7252758.1 OmpA family protein [Helicobacter sp. faydin-H75]MDP2538626.1 OmpA family protein [Helicobacter sp. faydin-H76]